MVSSAGEPIDDTDRNERIDSDRQETKKDQNEIIIRVTTSFTEATVLCLRVFNYFYFNSQW